MRKFIFILFISVLFANSEVAKQLTRRVEVLSVDNSNLLNENFVLESSRDSLKMIIKSYEDLTDAYGRRIEVLDGKVDQKKIELEKAGDKISNLQLLWYLVILLVIGLIVLLTIHFKSQKTKPQTNMIKVSKPPRKSSVDANTEAIQATVSREMEKGFRTLYKIVHESNEMLVSNNDKLSTMMDSIAKKDIQSSLEIDKITVFEPNKTEKIENEEIISSKNLNTTDFEFTPELNVNSDRVVTMQNDPYLEIDSSIVPEKEVIAAHQRSRAKREYGLSSTVLPSSSHSCLTEYNSILRQLNIGHHENQEYRRIEQFIETFEAIRLDLTKKGENSFSYSRTHNGRFLGVRFLSDHYLLPWFTTTLLEIDDVFDYKGTKNFSLTQDFRLRQVLRFALIEPHTKEIRLLEKGNII